MLIQEQVAEGRNLKLMVANDGTDDVGRYHFAHLRPGAYYIAVVARPWYADAGFMPRIDYFGERIAGGGAARSTGNPALDVAYPLTFYPGVTDSTAASAITLQAGDRASADFGLRAVPALHVRISNAASEQNGKPEQGRIMRATVVQTIFDGIEIPQQSGMRETGSGVMMMGIAPGHYIVRFTPNVRRFQRLAQPAKEDEEQAAPEQPARVREVDLVSDTELDAGEMAPTAMVSGTVKLANGQAPLKPLSIQLRRGAFRQALGARSNAQGEFTFPQGVAAGSYQIFMSSGDDLFIRSVRATGAKMMGRTLNISGPEAVKLSITASVGAGKIEGMALKGEKAQAGAMILLVPQDVENNLPLVRRDQSDSDGSFTLSSVIAGRYTLLALENGWDMKWGDAAVLKPLLANGETIVVDGNGSYRVKLKVQ
jgi:hypothetical protein